MAKGLSKQQQQIIVFSLIAVILGGYVYWNYMLSPTLKAISQNKQKHQGLIGKIERAQKQSRRLPALEAEYQKLQTELSSLEKQLPKDKNVPNILRTLTREALRENLQFTSLTPGKLGASTYFHTIPFQITLEGSLHGFTRFLSSLGQQERIFKADQIKMSPLSKESLDGGKRLSITVKIESYAYKG